MAEVGRLVADRLNRPEFPTAALRCLRLRICTYIVQSLSRAVRYNEMRNVAIAYAHKVQFDAAEVADEMASGSGGVGAVCVCVCGGC